MLLGDVDEVKHFEGTPSFVKASRKSQRKMQGLRYQYKAQEHLKERFPDMCVPGPWFQYRIGRMWNFMQPDVLLVDILKGKVTIVEIKYAHVADAYFQLVDKYLPVLKVFFGPQWTFAICEMVKWYDRDVAFPTRVRMREDLSLIEPSEFAVHIWNPNRP